MSDVRKGDVVHFVNDTPDGDGLGKHLAATVVRVNDGEQLDLQVFFEQPNQFPGAPHGHLWKNLTERSSKDQTVVNTWHLRDECTNGE